MHHLIPTARSRTGPLAGVRRRPDAAGPLGVPQSPPPSPPPVSRGPAQGTSRRRGGQTEAGPPPYQVFIGCRSGLWEKLLWRPDHGGHDAVVEGGFLFRGFFENL